MAVAPLQQRDNDRPGVGALAGQTVFVARGPLLILGVAILVAIIGHPSSADAVAVFCDGWTFIIVAALAAAAALFVVGELRIGAAVPEQVPLAARPDPETLAA